MTHLDFHFDPISPYAWLAFERLPQVLPNISHSVAYRPLLLGAVLQHWGQKGPAEIEPKKAWSTRQVTWLAQRDGIDLRFPLQHPFNPLPLLRLLLACAPDGGTPNRWACEQVFRHVWCADTARGGAAADANDPARLAALAQRLAPLRDPQGAEVKQALKDATAAAIGKGVFGVPSIEAAGRLYWGQDALEMLAGELLADPRHSGA